MRKRTLTLSSIAIAATLSLAGCGSESTNEPTMVEFNNTADKQTYAFGQKVGSHVDALMAQGNPEDINKELLIRGFSDAINKQGQLTNEDVTEFSKVFTDSLTAQQKAKAQQLEQENLEKAQAYLENNKLASDVTTTESGLQYKVVKAGTGPKPSATSVVRVAYEGRLIDGTVIDKRSDDTSDVLFLEKVIPGWKEGLQMMSEGSQYTLYVHPELAYGTQKSPKIPPNSTLIFDVELLEIIKP